MKEISFGPVIPRESNIIALNEDGRPVTTSLIIAEKFGKRHDHILRDIEDLEIPDDFYLPNFGETSYTDNRNRKQPMYNITRDGFTLLAMGFSGKKAMKWKIRYIEAFNKMENALVNRLVPIINEMKEELAGFKLDRMLASGRSMNRQKYKKMINYRKIGLTQKETAKLLDVSVDTIQRYESYSRDNSLRLVEGGAA